MRIRPPDAPLQRFHGVVGVPCVCVSLCSCVSENIRTSLPFLTSANFDKCNFKKIQKFKVRFRTFDFSVVSHVLHVHVRKEGNPRAIKNIQHRQNIEIASRNDYKDSITQFNFFYLNLVTYIFNKNKLLQALYPFQYISYNVDQLIEIIGICIVSYLINE